MTYLTILFLLVATRASQNRLGGDDEEEKRIYFPGGCESLEDNALSDIHKMHRDIPLHHIDIGKNLIDS